MTPDMKTEHDEETLVERTDVGVSITTKIKRGTGTRDQDEHTIKSKGHTVEEAIESHIDGMAYVENTLLDQARAIQPEVDDDE